MTLQRQLLQCLCVLPLLQVTLSQRAVDELVGSPLQGEVITSLVEGQVAPQHLHVLLLAWEKEKEQDGHDVRT